MSLNAYDAYTESSVLMADPIELVQILYRGALEAVLSARRYLQEGDIRARSREITKASAILTELSLSLDHTKGASVSRNLVELYDYMQTRLIVANAEQSDEPLAEVNRLLGTLLEAWLECRPQEQNWKQSPFIPPTEPAAEQAARNWSL